MTPITQEQAEAAAEQILKKVQHVGGWTMVMSGCDAGPCPTNIPVEQLVEIILSVNR